MDLKYNLEKAKENGFLISGFSKKGTTIEDQFYWWCVKNEKPYIVIRRKVKFSTIIIDIVTFKEEKMPGLHPELVKKYVEILKKGSAKKAKFNLGSEICYSSKIFREKDEEIAKEFVKNFNTYH